MIFRKSMKRIGAAIFLIVTLLAPFSSVLAAPEQTSPMVTVSLPEEEAALFEYLTQVRDVVEAYSTKDVDLRTLYQGAIRGMIEALDDRYSQYLTDEQMAAFTSSVEGDYVGVGITIDTVGGNIRVVNTFSGSPAFRAGLHAGDIILSVGEYDMTGKTHLDAATFLRGQEGVAVEVTVFRPGTGQTLQFTMIRLRISPPALDVRDLGEGIYYIKITQFNRAAGREFPPVINYLKATGLKGLVLDLRDNPGGTLDDCVTIANELVPKGAIVELRRKDLSEVIENPGDTVPVPVAVLVNGGSASASEILAGAIRDRNVGVIVGQPTFGKACVQALVRLGDGMGGIRLTIADYYTPAGHLIAEKGLIPDLVVHPERPVVPQRLQQTRSLTQGMVGLDVQAVQENLKILGFDAGPVDGILGPRTLQACLKFCQEMGQDFDGVLTPDVADAIYYEVFRAAQDVPDRALEAALKTLLGKLETGHWPNRTPNI